MSTFDVASFEMYSQNLNFVANFGGTVAEWHFRNLQGVLLLGVTQYVCRSDVPCLLDELVQSESQANVQTLVSF